MHLRLRPINGIVGVVFGLHAMLLGCGSHTLQRSADAGADHSDVTGGFAGDASPPTEDAASPVPSESACLIDGISYLADAVDPSNACRVCTPQSSTTGWSPRDGIACDDGLFCNGADTCSGGSCSVHAGNPCPDATGNLCGSTCDEASQRCPGTGRANDCGTWACGLSPSGCFACGTCDAAQACMRGRCGCTPELGYALAAKPPAIPTGLKSLCLADPNQTSASAECPIITCGPLTYWAFSLLDNSVAMTLVGYDASQEAVFQLPLVGARYIYKITLDRTAQTLTLIGQSNQQIVVPWFNLWP